MFSVAVIAIKMSALITIAGLIFARLLRPAEATWVRTRAVPLTTALYVVGMFTPSIWLLYLFIVAVIPLASRNRSEAAAYYMLCVLGLPRLEHPGMLGSMFLLTLDKWVLAAIGISIAAAFNRTKRDRVAFRYDLPFILFLILELIQARGADNFTSWLRAEVNALISFAIPYYFVTRSLRSIEDIRRLLIAISFGMFVLSVGAFYESRTTFLFYDMIGQRLGSMESTGGYMHVRSGVLRAHVTFGDATAFGIYVAAGFIVMMTLRDLFRSRAHYYLALLVIFMGLYATNSRGAIVTLALGIVCYDIYLRHYGKAATKILSLAGAYLALSAVAQFSSKLADRMGGASADTVEYRQRLLTRGLEEIRKHALFGIDPNQVPVVLADLRQGEGIVDIVNGYIGYGLTTGMFGMVALLLCFVLPAGKAFSFRRRMRRDPVLLNLAGMACTLGLMTMQSCATNGFGGRTAIFYFILTSAGLAAGGIRMTQRQNTGAPALRSDPAAPAGTPGLVPAGQGG